ncbi:MFS transporter [Paenarthrobacter sp. 2TAF44]|uniref:MFS transporter n=1 Tax=Paenarthrobacter sp. 2TAF44 TaxID=3233018 RepID=UPI003F992D9B
MTAFPESKQSLSSFTDHVGLTWRHWAYFTLITLVLLADGMEVTIISHTFPSLVKEWGVSVGGGITLIVTAGFITMGMGAIIAGRLADVLGRKTVLTSAAGLFSIATTLGATSPDFTAFTMWRLVACFGIGAVMPTGVTLLADLVPAKRRAAMVAAAYAGVGLGTTVGAALAGLLIPSGGWRALLVAGGLAPVLIIITLAFLVPEPPAFRAARGATERAKQGLARLAPKVDLADVDLTPPAKGDTREALKVVVSKRFAVTTILLWVFGFFSLGTQLLIAQYLPTLLQQPVPGLNTVQSSTIVGAYGFSSVLGGLVLGAILTKASRYLTIGLVLGMSVAMTLVIALVPSPGFSTLLPLFTIAGFILPTGFGPTRNILATAAYPTAVRGTGVGMTELGARLGSAAGGAAGGTLIGAGLSLSAIFLALLVPLAVLLGALVGLRAEAKRTGETGAEASEEVAGPVLAAPTVAN